MSHKDGKSEKEKSIHEKIKSFLKSDKKNLKNLPEIKITEELKLDLGPTSSYETRLKTIRELEKFVQKKKFQDTSIEKIWVQVKDLLTINNPPEIRHAVLSLFSTIASTSERLGQRRILFMKHIMDMHQLEDVIPLFNFLHSVINDGRNIEYIEEEIAPFLIKWLPILFSSMPSTVPVIELATNLLKFNAAHIDDHIISQLVIIVINQLPQSRSEEELYACLKFMDTLIAYVFIPSGTFTKFVAALSRLVSISFIVEDAWKVMRNLLRTKLGDTALCSLCELIEMSDNFHIVRGSIYFVTCALWSKQKISSLTFGPMAILPTLYRASESLHPLVIYETSISVSKLVRNHSDELHLSSWDLLLDVLERLFYFTANYSNKEQAQMIFNVMNGVVDEIEDRISGGVYKGTLSKFYNIVDCYSKQRQIQSVYMILDYKIQSLHHDQNHWLISLTSLIHRHFREDPRASIRLRALSKLRYVFDKYKGSHYAEQICDIVVVSQLDEIEKDPEMVVRKAAVSLLIHMVLALQGPVIEKILPFIEKVILAPYAVDSNFGSFARSYHNGDVDDIHEAVQGLICVFKRKIWVLPSSYAIQAYQILMSSLELHYRNTEIMEKVPSIRREIFKMIFAMRADAYYHLGLPDCPDAQIEVGPDDPEDLKELLPKFSSYIVIDHKFGLKPISLSESSSGGEEGRNGGVGEGKDSSPPFTREEEEEEEEKEGESDGEGKEMTKHLLTRRESCEPMTVVTHLSLTKAARIVIVAMKKEKDWSLLKMILEKVPQVLQNKALILSKDGNDIDYLATTLCALISDESLKFPDSLHNTPPKFSKSDFEAYVYPVMASLCSYHLHLDYLYQRNIVQCLQNGMSSKSAPQCVSAMTLCVLEMRNTMVKLLRDVMIQLSKISATVQNAQPTLEFLSTLLHLPRVYSDFLPNQYLTVFAISIPYTNPFKFNHYIVSLAYHVICMWFMKCRIPHRKGFINFISKNLNMILVNEQTATKMKTSVSGDPAGKGIDTSRIQFHKDLRETCVDFMARNCFDSYAPETIRSPVSQMLFNRGAQQTWLFGTRIITVTTSGCSKKPIKHGLCDKCVQFCLFDDSVAADVSPSQPEYSASRRRHKTEFHRSVSHEVKHQPQTKDDLHMRSSFREMQYSEQSNKESNIEDLLYANQAEKKSHICCCWCSRWAEIMIIQPTGNVSYAVRVLNPQTLTTKEESVPVQDLSSFYFPYSQQAETSLFNSKELTSFPESLYDNCNTPTMGNIRPRASSGGSERTQTSETGMGLGEEWSNSGSTPSSGATSLTSSETKLNAKAEEEAVKDPNHVPVYHCHSNPEVNKGLIEAGAFSDEKGRHHPLAHSFSMIEQPLGGLREGQKTAAEHSAPSTFIDKVKPRMASGAVRRCNSSVGSPSPPPSVDQSNRIRHASAMQMKSGASPLAVCNNMDEEEDSTFQPVKRGRGHTISDMNPARNRPQRNMSGRRPTLASNSLLSSTAGLATISTSSLPSEPSANTSNTIASSNSTSVTSSSKSGKEYRAGISPSAVFLQLYYQGCFGGGSFRPILLPTQNPEIERAIKLMDYVKPHEHHRIGVIYVGPMQTTEAEIFSNVSGSERYHQFVDGLGPVYEIKLFSENTNLGGLDKRGVADGHLIHMWQDDLMQVVFHVATTMPNKETDPNGHNKKKHIGNDYVTIVYNNSGRPYNLNTIKSQYNHTVVEITPGDHNTNCVKLLTKPTLSEFVSWDNNDIPRLISDASLPLLGRQLAIHANLASKVWESLKHSNSQPYAANWMDRLQKVRKLRELVLGKVEAERHMQEMQHLQFPMLDPNELQNQSFLDFSDMIEIDKMSEIKDVKDRSRTASFLNRR